MEESSKVKRDDTDGRRTYREIWQGRLTETYQQGSCEECCSVLRHLIAEMLTGMTWQLGLLVLVLIEVFINLILMLVEFHVIKDETHLARILLHFLGIFILGIFVLEVLLKFYSMGCEYYLKDKMEIFDAFIVLSAFTIEIVLSVLRARKAWKGFSFIIILRLWRIFRVVTNLVVFGEDFYELIEEDGAKPAQQEETETEKGTEKSEEKQALTRSD
ncbi:voltage-gated hydrogen channel 1-like [Porites lutea]|uniref:voltage-gated hydrogen channel 1-like n=1 Tax=Porites lutea TaxID=51062 RepID=UPI003CC67EA7